MNTSKNFFLYVTGILVIALLEHVLSIFFIDTILRYAFTFAVTALLMVSYLKVSFISPSISDWVNKNKYHIILFCCFIAIHSAAKGLFVMVEGIFNLLRYDRLDLSYFLIMLHVLISLVGVTFVFVKQVFKKD